MNRLILLWGGFLLFTIGICRAQSVTIHLPDTSSVNGDTLMFPVSVENFMQVVSIQFSMNWDTSVVQYLAFEKADLENIEAGDLQAADGVIRVVWFAQNGESETLVDGTNIFHLQFLVKGQIGETGSVTVTDQPLRIQIAVATDTPGIFDFAELAEGNGSVTVVEREQFRISSTQENIDCRGSENGSINVQIQSDGAPFSINWSGPDNFTSADQDLSGLSAGSYSLQVFDQSGEIVLQDSFQISEPAEDLVISNIEIVPADCETMVGTATLAVTGGTGPYTFDLGQGVVNNNEFEDLPPGQYSVNVRDANGCSISDGFNIEAPEDIFVDLGDDLTICLSESTVLSAGDFASYRWSTGSTEASLEVSESGTYGVTVSNESACLAEDEITVTVSSDFELPFEQEDLLVCPQAGVELAVSGGDTYEWIDTSGTLSRTDIANPIANPAYFTSYQVIASTSCGADSATFFVDLYEVEVSAGPDTCVGNGLEVELAATGGQSYNWLESIVPISDITVPNPIVKPEETTTFVVLITDDNGCEIRDSVQVVVATDPEDIQTVNLLTPNGDGKNDALEFPGIAKFGANTLRVYNRWGNLVYQKVNYMIDEERFDGTYKGEQLPVGNYYYILSFRTAQFRQTLTLVRE